MLRALKIIHGRISVRKYENIDERAKRLAPMKTARWAIIAFGFSLALAATGLLFATQRTEDHQAYFLVVLSCFAGTIAGAQLLFWSNRAGPAQDVAYFDGETIRHRPSKWGRIHGTVAALGLRALAAATLVASCAGVLWVVWAALRMPAPVTEPAAPVEQVAPLASSKPISRPALSGILSDKDIVDGDTFDLAHQRVRPRGYDTPERGKTCESNGESINVYDAATQALHDFALGKEMNCDDTGERDRDARLIATCRVGSEDLGEHMVRLGWARDWPRYSQGAYCEFERGARAENRGLWALTCPDDVWDGRDYVDPATGIEC